LKRLRQEYRTRHVPVILLTARDSAADRIENFRAGADDYITKPFDVAELLARARAALERSEVLRGLNPITRLPGNADIAHEIERRLRSGEEFACLYADLDGFKSYNDHYGFARGDGVIKLFGESIIAAVEAGGARDGFVGHIGGDDFIALVPQSLAESVAADIAHRFDAAVPYLYDDADRLRGTLEYIDRAGVVQHVPIVSVSIGIVPAEPWRFATAVEVGRSAAEVKEAAKREPGSTWVVDRRGR
jgi:diguanylate cyclase (GGDEF)-like protein